MKRILPYPGIPERFPRSSQTTEDCLDRETQFFGSGNSSAGRHGTLGFPGIPQLSTAAESSTGESQPTPPCHTPVIHPQASVFLGIGRGRPGRDVSQREASPVGYIGMCACPPSAVHCVFRNFPSHTPWALLDLTARRLC